MASAPGRGARADRDTTALSAVPPVLLVAAGGVVGALARYAVGLALPHPPGSWAWSTLVVNTVGAALLCVLLPLVRTPSVGLFLATGLLASFTTFSGFMVDAVLLAHAGRPAVAVGYVLASLVTLVVGALAGVAVGRLAKR